jgi:outer membrane receptor protein involved in Fe transport
VCVAADAAAEPRYESTVVYARPRRDDDGSLVLTQRELQERGVANLAEALDLLATAALRLSGRGETRVDVRGVPRQVSLLVLVDGVPVSEPYLGGFDLGAIPVIDIVAVRLSPVPASPLEGPGGDGGVVEVTTRRATGPRRVDGRERLSTAPELEGAASARTPLGLGGGAALRVSAGGGQGGPRFPTVSSIGAPVPFAATGSQAYATLRVEAALARARLTADAAYQWRSYAAPPTEESGADVSLVPSEHSARLMLGVEGQAHGWRLSGSAYGSLVQRRTELYDDATLARTVGHEDLQADRAGGALFFDGPLGRRLRLQGRLSVDAEDATVQSAGAPTAGHQIYVASALGAELRWRWLRVEGALGAVLAANGRAPWPEARLACTLAPLHAVSLRLLAAHKGRLPSLREQFAPGQGNPSLGPERSTYVEAQVAVEAARWLRARVTGYWRAIDGLIRLDARGTQFVNLGSLEVRGLEAGVAFDATGWLSGGATYLFGDAASPALGVDPLFHFPEHRADAWLSVHARDRAGGTLRVRYVGDRMDRDASLAPYVLVDASAFARIERRLTVAARVDNLLDARYALRAGLAAPGITASLTLEGTWP